MLLQSGPRFTVPFALTAGFGLLLALAGVAVLLRESDSARRNQAIAAALALSGLGFIALAFQFAGTMAALVTGLDRPDGTPMEPTLLGRIGLAVPWEAVALALFVAAVAAAVVGVGAAVRDAG